MKPKIHIPQRGDNVRLVELACKNALEEAERVTGKEERVNATLALLGKILDMDAPGRIESYDISNISGTDIVASMVVFQEGKPKKSAYKRFKLEGLSNQDDYASMQQVLRRRFVHYKAGDSGFAETPDLLLIDGGVNHARVALGVLQEQNLAFSQQLCKLFNRRGFLALNDLRHHGRRNTCFLRKFFQRNVFVVRHNSDVSSNRHDFTSTY